MNAFKDFIIKCMVSMLEFFDTQMNGAVDLLTQDIMAADNPMFQIAQSIATAITPIALTIIGICFLIEFLKITVKMDILKWEFALKVFILLALSQAVISAAPHVLGAIYGTGSDLILKAMGGTACTIGGKASIKIQTLTENMKWAEVLGVAVMMTVPIIGIIACAIITKVMAFARMFEIIVHVAASPIPCAFMPLEGSHMTKKFFLSFAAVCLQGMFMIICIQLFGIIVTSALQGVIEGSTNMMDIVFNLLVGAMVLVMSIVKTGQWSKSILDAN